MLGTNGTKFSGYYRLVDEFHAGFHHKIDSRLEKCTLALLHHILVVPRRTKEDYEKQNLKNSEEHGYGAL